MDSRIKNPRVTGFTLIELSIVLVIIGLITGGVLVGRDLIQASAVRAQIAQIEKIHTSTATFRGKYDSLPGDIAEPAATQFGFAARGPYAGEGDGNGLIEGIVAHAASNNCGFCGGSGEAAMFWVDLARVRLIDGGFSTATPIAEPSYVSGTTIAAYFPAAKIGRGGSGYSSLSVWSGLSTNYLQLGTVKYFLSSAMGSDTGLTPIQASAIDSKTDDGLPMSGRVMAVYSISSNLYYWSDSYNSVTYFAGPYTSATSAASTSCYDNGNATGQVQKYSIGTAGNSTNCVLSFRFP